MKLEGFNISSIKNQLKPLMKTLHPILRHMVFITILASLGFLIFAAYSITGLLTAPSDSAYKATKELTFTQTKFDQDTINLVLGLKLITDPNDRVTTDDFSVKPTRNSPFTE